VALVAGTPPQQRGTIDLHIRRNPSRPTRMETVAAPGAAAGPPAAAPPHVSASGYSNPRHDVRPRPARTRYVVLRRLDAATLLRFVLETGRTHQIRVHAQGAGFPLLGDPLYGPAHPPAWAAAMQRPALHASRLEFEHPVTRQRLRFQSPLPSDMRDLIQAGALRRPTAVTSPRPQTAPRP
jgi:23S rRNA-/tRNA-specific pseudouridylate synthase